MKSPQTEDGFTKIANELLEAFTRLDASGSAWRVFMVVLRKTYGYHKKEDRISLTQFEKMSGLTRMSVCRGLSELIELRVITVQKNGYINVYEVQKDYELWGSIKPVTSNKNDTKTSIKPVTKSSNKNDTYKRKKEKKDISEQSSPIKGNNNNDMGNWDRTSDNDDDLPSINDDREIEDTDQEKLKKENAKVRSLMEWGEKIRRKPFMDKPTQIKHIKLLKAQGVSPEKIKDTFSGLLYSEYWKGQDRLPDFKTVVSSLKNKK